MQRIIKACISGVAGRMGQAVLRLLQQEFAKEFEVVYGVYRKSSLQTSQLLGNTLPKMYGADSNGEDNFDIIIDFSSPQNSVAMLDVAVDMKIPIVIGTTGLTDSDKQILLDAASQIPVFFCEKMSITFECFKDNIISLAKTLPIQEYDIEIIDIHHRNKKDSPSGAAKILFEAIKNVRSSKAITAERFGKTNAKESNSEIGISSIRSGEDIIGEHRVIFAGKDDRIELMHRSSSRDVYARGAICAAKWLLSQHKGLYGISDIT